MGLERAVTTGLASRIFAPGSARTLAFLRAVWPAVVGADLAQRTELLAIENDALRVRVPDARWRKVLHRMQGEILSRLRRVAGDLAPRRLGFSEGPVAAPVAAAVESRRDAASPEPLPLPASVAKAAEAIPDLELRARFLETATRYLGRSR